MAPVLGYLPGWLLFLFITSQTLQTGVFSLRRSEIVCQMVKRVCCHGRFIKRIVATCHPEERDIPNRGFHGNTCSRDDECFIQDSACYAGICLCRLGLYFCPSQNTCVRECVEFGSNMDVYPGVGLYNNNIEERQGITLQACCEMCLHMKSYQCRSVDFGHSGGYCFTSDVGFLEVEPNERDYNARGWTFGQRQCDHPST